jgi:formamidopyrimidine-DNA glycosylase
MSHGHTTHRAARDHAQALCAQPLLVSSPQGRFHYEALLGDAAHVTLSGVEAYGEHLFYRFARGQTVHVVLGPAGYFIQHPSPPPVPHEATRLRLLSDRFALDLLAPATCELVSDQDKQAMLARLGPDPLRGDASPERFFAYAVRSRNAVGVALQNQKVIAGVSAAEGAGVLHALGIEASTPLRTIPHELIEQLWQQLVERTAA